MGQFATIAELVIFSFNLSFGLITLSKALRSCPQQRIRRLKTQKSGSYGVIERSGELMQKKKFDLAVIGGGPGGYPAAIRAAQMGKSVALIERDQLGGTCLNRGCIPSKALIAGADFFSHLQKASDFGIALDVEKIALDYGRLAKHKDAVVERMRIGLESLIAANQITVMRGQGQLLSQTEVKITGNSATAIETDKIILATGSEPRQIAAFPCDGVHIHDSTSLLSLKELPKSILIIGGGVIGCEFASLYANLKVEVTIAEILPTILSTEAEEVRRALFRILTKRGVRIETNILINRVVSSRSGIEAWTQEGACFKADCCLVAAGRRLNTSGIGLEKVGVAVDEKGMVIVNDRMETSVSGIYAVGDIASKWWLAHVASHQGLIAAENACGRLATMRDNAIPSVIFTNPQAASVGLSCEEAKRRGFRAKIGLFPFSALGKAQAVLHPEGFAQIVIDEKTGQILGAQVVGFAAAELIAQMGCAIANELTVESLSETILAHPTFSEVWGEAALIAEGMPLHFPPSTSFNSSV